jgi:hypothetical protein
MQDNLKGSERKKSWPVEKYQYSSGRTGSGEGMFHV